MFELRSKSLADFLAPYAAYALKNAAEGVIIDKVESYRREVSKEVYAEVERLSIRFVEGLKKDDMGREVKIVIEDRTEKSK